MSEEKSVGNKEVARMLLELATKLMNGSAASSSAPLDREDGLPRKHQHPWTEAEERLLVEMVNAGKTDEECSKILNRTAVACSQRCTVLRKRHEGGQNVPVPELREKYSLVRKWKPEDDEMLVALRAQGVSIDETARRMNRSFGAILSREKYLVGK